jgi:hypothetical protein
MRLKIWIIFAAFTLMTAWARAGAQCPWLNLKGQELLQFSYRDDLDPALTTSQIQEDLACLKILLQNKYAALDRYPEINLMGRLNVLSQRATPSTSSQLLESIFELHRGMPDVHLSYQVNGIHKRFSGQEKREVGIKEQLEKEKIIDRGEYVYFKPAEVLMPQVTDAQKSFLEFVTKTDRNLVIDLREVRGGGGSFPEELAQRLFTVSQNIPQKKTQQIRSGLVHIGFAVTARIVYGDQVKDFFESIRESVNERMVSDLIAFEIEEEVTQRSGQRLQPFQSKIVLLIDGSCASECETIVELLSAHPNAKLVGQNTMGALHFSNAVSFTLPHSGIWVRIPSLVHILENDAEEGVGYVPHEFQEFVDLNQIAF